METCCSCRTIPAVEALPSAVKSKGHLKALVKIRSVASIGSQGSIESCGNRGFAAQVSCRGRRKVSTFVTLASAESSKCESPSMATPLEPQSSAGKFLSGILKNHRHIFHVAVAEQLEELAAGRDGAVARRKHSLGSVESCLHGRIAEMKEQQCQIAVEEVIYMLVVHKFSEIQVPMVPQLSKCINNGKLNTLPWKDRELESVHSLEVLEMIHEHLSTILGGSVKSDATFGLITSRIPRLHLGRLYAASIMFGYFLKSACQRHRLELNLALTHQDLPLGHGIRAPLTECRRRGSDNLAVLDCRRETISTLYQGSGRSRKAEKLRGYVMGFDPETLQRCARLKSREAVNLVEKHSWALFGDSGLGDQIGDGEVVTVTFSSLKRLVLEATAFGSFLWDVERYVDSIYKLKDN